MKNRKYTNRTYLDRLQEQVMIFDGAMGTNLQNKTCLRRISEGKSLLVVTIF